MNLTAYFKRKKRSFKNNPLNLTKIFSKIHVKKQNPENKKDADKQVLSIKKRETIEQNNSSLFIKKSGASRLKSHGTLPKQITSIHPWAKAYGFLRGIKLTKKTVILLSIVLFSIGLIAAFNQLNVNKIKYISCDIENLPCEQVGIQIPNIINQNYFTFSLKSITPQLQYKYPQIKDVKVTKKIPSTIQIKLTYRQPVATIEDKKFNRYFIDNEGVVFSQATDNKSVVIKTEEPVALGEKMVSDSIRAAIELAKTLEQSQLPTKAISIYGNDTIEVSLTSGKIIFFTATKDVTQQVDTLQFILQTDKIEENKKSTIDLRFNNPIIK
jgi:cell division septal protein FtsQ